MICKFNKGLRVSSFDDDPPGMLIKMDWSSRNRTRGCSWRHLDIGEGDAHRMADENEKRFDEGPEIAKYIVEVKETPYSSCKCGPKRPEFLKRNR